MLLLALLTEGCLKESQKALPKPLIEKTNTLTPNQAQEWLEAERQKMPASDNARKGVPKTLLKFKQFRPQWQKIKQWITSGKQQTLEIPIQPIRPLTLSIPTDPRQKEDTSDKKQPVRDFARLVMARDSSGEIEAVVMEVIGSSAYLKENHFDLSKSSFLRVDSTFSGVVIFRNFPSGQFMWGYQYVNGRRTGNVSFHPSKHQDHSNQRMKVNCSFPVYGTQWDCSSYIGEDGVFTKECTPLTVIIGYADYDCSAGGGGSGGSSPPLGPPHGGGTGGGIPTGYPKSGNKDLPTLLPPLMEIKYDSLAKDYPCVVKLIIKELESDTLYKSIVQPFTNSHYPDLIWSHNLQSWDPTGHGTTSLGYTGTIPDPFASNSSTIFFNDKMLVNATQLMIAATTIHESVHAYAKFYLSMKNIQIEPKSSWITSAFDALKLQDSLNNNARDHMAMMRDQIFPEMVKMLKDWGGSKYRDKECQMAVLYGLNNAGDLSGEEVSQETIDTINKLYKVLLKKYNIDDKELNDFYRDQLFNASDNEKIPQGCTL